MKEINNIIEAYKKIDFTQNQAALATVVYLEGSSYRRIGARMLILDSGEWIGGISGGCLEGDTLRKARLTMLEQKARLVRYDTTDDDPAQIGVGLGCNGIIDVLITPLNPENPQNAVVQLINQTQKRVPSVILTVIDVSNDANIQLGDVFNYADDENFKQKFPIKTIQQNLLKDINTSLLETKSASKTYQLSNKKTISILVEILMPAIHLVINGSNYDVYPLLRIAKELGWKVSIICNPKKMHATVLQLADNVLEKHEMPDIDSFTAVALMSHDYENDYQALQKTLKTDINYIGMLGPAKRNAKMYQQMNDPNLDLTKIYNPIGLDIGANTPEEIAISIIAEIKAFFAEKNGTSLKHRTEPIH
jgi:xanthine/CO dehydrogenase XdhC/CoxF family maturation factor